MSRIEDPQQRLNRLCELNVIEQAANVCQTTVVQSAWDRGQDVSVHSWIYSIADRHLKYLNFCVKGHEGFNTTYLQFKNKIINK